MKAELWFGVSAYMRSLVLVADLHPSWIDSTTRAKRCNSIEPDVEGSGGRSR